MKSYKKPVLNVERFTPNEFVAACGDENKVYKFQCDAITEWGVGLVYVETNGEPGLQRFTSNSDTYRGPYHPCGEKHETPYDDDAFLDGYYVHNISSIFEPTPIKIWTGLNDDNTHCTTNVHMETWETAKS